MGLFHSKVAHYYFRVKNIFFRVKTAQSAHLIVEVEQGRLRGKESKAALSRKKYCSFLGVPFAKPPIGDLRFRPPQPREPWQGIYDATYERNDCIQNDPFLYVMLGDEDCLHMNIYTPKPPAEIIHPLPVMAYVHGGGFIFGSSSRKFYGADHLINRDVILVAFNYRLHMLGFLNLGIEECPGNVGMKDQVLALQWIQRNIRNFGGDPNNVTIFGESAGASSVHFLMISPLAQGLFHKAILQSGMALIQWSFTYNPIEVAFALGRKCGFRGTDRHKLVEHLKKQSAGDLTRICDELFKDNYHDTPIRVANMSPSIESIVEGAFLPDHPLKLMKIAKPIPTIWGYCRLESLAAFKIFGSNVMDRMGRDFTLLLKNNFKIDPDVLPVVAEEVRELYFGNEEVSSSTAGQLVDVMTDVWFYRFYEAADPLLKSQIPPYLYKFTYNGRLNFILQYMKLTQAQLALFTDLDGATHGDDVFYLFYAKMLLLYPPLKSRDIKMIRTMTMMWANFARTGNPSTEDVEWLPATSGDLQYLEITDEPVMQKGKIAGERFEKLHEILDPISEPI